MATPLKIEYRALARLHPHDRNPRTHSRKQIRQIARSIERFGFTNPVLIDDAGRIIAGHGRVEAAKHLGMTEVPTVRLAAMSEAQKRAYIIADNKLAENAGWDRELLALELEYIAELDAELDLTLTGFEMAEIDLVLEGDGSGAVSDALPEIDPSAPVVSRPGDLWQLGPHRLLCGDARSSASYTALLGGERARMIFTDPPFNVPIGGHVSGLGKIKHDEFVMASGEMSASEFVAFLGTVLGQLATHSTDGSLHFVCMDWRHAFELLSAARPVYAEFKNLCIWNKDNGGMGSLYRSKHELVFLFKNGTAPHINNVALGRHGRYRTNVWDYAGVNTLKRGRQAELTMHPTVKPVALVADAIKDCSNRGDIILDAFAGSGTTIIAAEETGRRGYALELDPRYVDVAVRRWQAHTGDEASETTTGFSFAEAARWARTSEPAATAAEKETVDGR
jgi:DNA modification methylase